MMFSLDRHLALYEAVPSRRSLNAARLVSIALNLSGTPILGGSEDRGIPFGPRDLICRVFEWFDANYGERNKIDMALGRIVLPLHNTYWMLDIQLVYGTAVPFADRNLDNKGRQIGTGNEPATVNVLRCLRGITQPYASRLADADIHAVLRAYRHGYAAMAFLDSLTGHPLFSQARADYNASVEALLLGTALSRARWDTAQCAEKVLKGLLGRAGHDFPTGGWQGHDIPHLGGLVDTHLGATLPEILLRAITCSPKVRYGEMNVDINEAWTSHACLLDLLIHLRSVPPMAGRT